MVYKAEFLFGLSKIESKGSFSLTQIAQLLSKYEKIAENGLLNSVFRSKIYMGTLRKAKI